MFLRKYLDMDILLNAWTETMHGAEGIFSPFWGCSCFNLFINF